MATQTITCPYCRETFYSIVPDGGPGRGTVPSMVSSKETSGAGWQRVNRRTVGIGAVPGDVVEYRRESPAQRPTKHHFMVPFAQASATAFAGLIVGVILTIIFSWPFWSPALIASFAFVWSWLLLLKYYNSLLKTTEHVIPTDEEPAQQQPVPTKRVRLHIEETGNHERRVELPIPLDTLATVARAVRNGRPFSIANLTGRGKPLTRGQFETLRDWLLECDYLRWVDDSNRQAGSAFTSKGKALLRGISG